MTFQAGLLSAESKYDQCVPDMYPIHSGSSNVSSFLHIQYGAKRVLKCEAKSFEKDKLCLPETPITG